MCYASRAQAAADRRYDDKRKAKPFHNGTEKSWAEKATASQPYHFREGVRVYVAPFDVNPEDNFI